MANLFSVHFQTAGIHGLPRACSVDVDVKNGVCIL